MFLQRICTFNLHIYFCEKGMQKQGCGKPTTKTKHVFPFGWYEPSTIGVYCWLFMFCFPMHGTHWMPHGDLTNLVFPAGKGVLTRYQHTQMSYQIGCIYKIHNTITISSYIIYIQSSTHKHITFPWYPRFRNQEQMRQKALERDEALEKMTKDPTTRRSLWSLES